MIPHLICQRVFQKDLQKLPTCRNHIIMPRRRHISFDKIQRHLRPARVLRLGAGKFRSRADQPEDLAVLPVEIHQLQHELGTGRRRFSGFLEARLQGDGIIRGCGSETKDKKRKEKDGL